jgi:hypothetical protein
MKNIIYIGFLAIVLLFSCSKEQPLSPINSSATVESSQITGSTGSSGPIIVTDDTSSDGDITDTEKEDKEKSNKKAKN